jgi:uncharacterized protein (TIGR02266 family)
MTEARKDRRAPASIKVKYKSTNMTEFVELIGGDVSRGGIFVKTKKPLEPGALLKFEFQLQTGEPMIYGVGRVAWRRTEEGSRANLPAGMGIKFIKLNGLSRSVIDRIEAKHGPGSRFDQIDGAEIASSISSAPPSGPSHSPEVAASVPPSATLITPLRPEAMRAVAEADARSTQPGSRESGRPTRSSPALLEARASGPRPSMLPATFRPPPPAAVDSVPPPHSSSNPPRSGSDRPSSSGAFGQSAAAAGSSKPAGQAAATSGASRTSKSGGAYSLSGSSAAALSSTGVPRGALSSGAPGRAASTRSAARDASEFLASAFSVGGAGREVRSEARAQAERARHDPRSVDLANELFGDLSAGAAKPEADAALDADPMLSHVAPTTPAPDPRATARLSPGPLPARLSPGPEPFANAAAAASPRPRPSARIAAANNQLSLKLGNAANETTLRPAAGGGRVVWMAGIAIVGLAVGAAAFYLQQGSTSVVGNGAEQQPMAAPQPEQPTVAPPVEAAPVVATVDLPVSSEPAGAEVKVDGVTAGNTPLSLKLAQGKTVQISLHLPGFAAKVESVNVEADMPARSVTLDPLPYELVVTEPVGATVKVQDKSVEAPAPLNLGALFPASGPGSGPQEVTVTVEKAGFQRATRQLTRADFQEQATAMRAELSIPLVATGPAAKAPAAAKAPPPKAAAPASKTAEPPKSAPPELPPPPEPEGNRAGENTTAAPSAAAPEKPKPEPAPSADAPPPAAPPPASDIPADL